MELEASKNNVKDPPSNPPIEDQLQEINLGTSDNPHPTFVNAQIKRNELEDFVYFLHEFIDCFGWTYPEMPGLDPKVVVHKLDISEDVKQVMQDQRDTKLEIMDEIENEVQKLKDVQFI